MSDKPSRARKEPERFTEDAPAGKKRKTGGGGGGKKSSGGKKSAAGGGKKKGTKKPKDPNAPKRNLTAYFFFAQEHRDAVKAKHPNLAVTEIAKKLGEQWGSVKDKKHYNDLAAKDKARYEKEKAAYEKKK